MKQFTVSIVVLLLVPGLLAADDDLHLYLLIGQSNMAGRGKVESQDKQPHPRVLTLDKSDQWVPAVDPIHFDKPVAGVGLGRSFGMQIADAYYNPTKSHPWDDAMRRAKLALQSGELKGILWHQGESDSKVDLASAYEAKLHDLIERLRTELKAPDVPFIVGQLGQFRERPWDDHRKTVDRAHRDLPSKVRYTAFVSSEGLQHKGDEVHFDAASYRELGKRYSAAFRKLLSEQQR